MRTAVLPTAQHLAWSECEVGVIIHLDVQVFAPEYADFRKCWGYTPPASVFRPAALDTDQWIATAQQAGAKYAVLVAKHCSGFSLWPTEAHGYSVRNAPWKDGKGDVVGDFMASCRKYGVRPGIYCSAACNAYLDVDNPGRVRSGDPEAQKRYNAVVEQQLTELWSRYGELFEIWFDGGVIPPEEGGPDLVPLLYRYQPNAVVFQGPQNWPALLRHVGNERACAPEPFWNTTSLLTSSDGTSECGGMGGSPEGAYWVPGEADMPNRMAGRSFQGGWFWREGEEDALYSLEELTACYFSSVGRNTNLLVGMVIDRRGCVPEADRARFAAFGAKIRQLFGSCAGRTGGEGEVFSLTLDSQGAPAILCLMEDLRYGERVRRFVVEGRAGAEWVPLWRGTNIGHKHLERFRPLAYAELRLRVLESAGRPVLREFSAWRVADGEYVGQSDPAERCRVVISRDRNDAVGLVCDNPGLSIRYTLDGTEPGEHSALYAAPFALPEGGTVKAVAYCHAASRSAVFAATFGCSRKNWKVVSVSFDSPYANGGAAAVAHLLNDDGLTYWHTYDADKRRSCPPHEVVLEMDREREVTGFTLLPCAEGGQAPTPDEYEFSLSADGASWTVAAAGRLTDLRENYGMRVIPAAVVMRGRYLKFRCLHALDGADYLKLAGIGVLGS